MKHRSRIPLRNNLWRLWVSGLFLLGTLAIAASPTAPPVVLHLRNGDRLTGEILKETRKALVLRSTAAGKITVPLDLIERREILGLPKAAVASGASTNSPPSVAPVTTPAVPALAKGLVPVPVPTAPPSAISARTNHSEIPGLWTGRWLPRWLTPFTTNWHGNVGLGMNLGFGTTERQTFFATANANHTWQRIINSANYNAAYGLVNEIESANRMEGLLKTEVFVDRSRKLYAYNLALGGYDAIRLIDRRLEEGVGMGYRVYERPRVVVTMELGGQYQSFNYARQEDRHLWSARISENLNWRPSDKLTLTQKFQFMPNIADVSDYRVRMDLIASFPVFKRITLSLNVVNEYESLPPRGVDNNDLQITTNVNITF